MLDDSLARIDGRLQAAALNPALWPDAIQSIAELTGATGGAFLPVAGRLSPLPHSEPLGELIDQYFATGWAQRCERAKGIPKLLEVGTFVDQDLVSSEYMARSSYYREFLEPLGYRWFAGLAFRASTDVWCLALQRSPRQGFFSRDEERGLFRFQSALSRAATLAWQLGHAHADGLANGFEALAGACFLLDGSGRVMRSTTVADAMLGRDFAILKGRVVPLNREHGGDVRQLVAAALWADVQPDSPHLRPVVLRRADKRPLILQAQPLRAEAAGYFGSARVMLMVTDLEARSPPIEELLRRTFSLTRSESRLAIALAQCFDLRAASDELGITYETARTGLKALFSKTETRRQSELLSLLARMN